MKWPWTNEIDKRISALEKLILQNSSNEIKSKIWVEAFSEGWSEAWDCMWPLQNDALMKMKRHIEEQAIQSILDRKNGNHKTDN